MTRQSSSGDRQGPPIDPADQRLSNYGFDLPAAAIAQRPVEPRHDARLLMVQPQQGSQHRRVWDLAEALQPGDLLVFNDTRVIKARLHATRPTGGKVELLLERAIADSPVMRSSPK